MGKTKRILSFLIAIIMVLALVPFNAIVYAVDNQNSEEAQTQAPEKDNGLPSATVSKLESQTISQYKIYDLVNEKYKGESTDALNPQVLMQFLAKETLEEANAGGFADYVVDFYVTVEGLASETAGTDCYLIGNYGEYGWVAIPLDEVTLNNTTYPIVSNYDRITYRQV